MSIVIRQGEYQGTCNLTNVINKFQRIKGIMIKKAKYVPNGIDIIIDGSAAYTSTSLKLRVSSSSSSSLLNSNSS